MTRVEVANAIVTRILSPSREGGIGRNPNEPYVTRFGQTPAWLEQYGFTPPQSREDARANYLRWLELTRLIELCDVLDSLADAVIDYAVHSGHPRAIRSLQAAIGARPDGIIGQVTLEQLARADRRRAAAVVVCNRNEYLYTLFATDPQQYAPVARGWGRRMSELIVELVA